MVENKFFCMYYIKNPKHVQRVYDYRGYEFWSIFGGELCKSDGLKSTISLINYRDNVMLMVWKSDPLPALILKYDRNAETVYHYSNRPIWSCEVRFTKLDPTLLDQLTGDSGKSLDLCKYYDNDEKLIENHISVTLKKIIVPIKIEIDDREDRHKKDFIRNEVKKDNVQKLVTIFKNIKID